MSTPRSLQLPESADIAVVGAGIIGLSIAYEARRRGHAVLLIDKHRCGGGATPVAAGMLAPVSEAEPSLPAMVELGLESCHLYPGFIAALESETGLDCGYRSDGTLAVALDRDQMEELEHRARAHRELGLHAERLTGRQAAALEPALSPRVVGALRTEIDRQVDPRRLAAALRNACERNGVTIAEGAELTGLHHDEAGALAAVTVRGVLDVLLVTGGERGAEEANTARHASGREVAANTAGTTIPVSSVVLCAGAWTHMLIPALAELPLYPVKGQVIRLAGERRLDHVVATPDVYLVPRRDGELVVGASAEEQGFDARPTAGVTMDLLAHAWRVLPSIYDLEVREINVGFRPALRDHMPAIGAIGVPGAYVATGHYRNGIMLAPVTARHLLETIEQGQPPAALRPFDPRRFGELAGGAPTRQTHGSFTAGC